MSKMFKTVTRTWNVFTGCKFDCTYCWVDELLKGRLGNTVKYKDIGKCPTFHPTELKKTFKPGDFVFVAAMGDISFAGYSELAEIINVIEANPETSFLLQTKNPGRFFYDCPIFWPRNVVFGTTIETNRANKYSKAPEPFERYRMISRIRAGRKFISIEPIMDFDCDTMTSMMDFIHPEIVEIGADNYHNNLPEPSWSKVDSLMSNLKSIGIKVVEKDGLRRLQKSYPKIRG